METAKKTAGLLLASLVAMQLAACVCGCPKPADAPSALPSAEDPAALNQEQAEVAACQPTVAPASGGLPEVGVGAEAEQEPELLEDEVAVEEPLAREGQQLTHPLDGVSDSEIRQRLKDERDSLGSMSIGAPNKGSLLNAIQMPDDPRWVRVDKSHAWGTQETVEYLQRAIGKVYEKYPDAAPLNIGHISGPSGGFLRPHRSHQSGRDVDLGYYYKQGGHWYLRADDTSLDRERTWQLVRALITETDVRFILIDHSIQKLLREYADSIGEDQAWLDNVFKGQGTTQLPLIRHAPGHRTHMHVRFYNPIAQETARRCYAGLVALKMIKPPRHYLQHKVKKGETLIHLAKRYGTSVKAIKRANGLRSNKILARKTYKIPRTGPASAGKRVIIPPRRLPPSRPQSRSRPQQPGAPADVVSFR